MKKFLLTILTCLGVLALTPVIRALSQQAPNIISASVGPNGTMSPDGNVSVAYDANETFTFTPDYTTVNGNVDYYTPEVTLDDNTAVALNDINGTNNTSTYTLSDVTVPHTVYGTFLQCVPSTGIPESNTQCASNYANFANNDIISNLNSNFINASWAKNPKSSIFFGANMNFAYGSTIGNNNITIQMLETYAHELYLQGIHRIEMNPTTTAYTQTTNGQKETDFPDNCSLTENNPSAMCKYSLLIQYIHSLGMIVAVNPEYNTNADGPGGSSGVNISTFAEFQNAAVLNAKAFASMPSPPDNYVVVHEPTTQTGRMSIATGTTITETPQQWIPFINAVGNEVKTYSNNITQIGAGIFAGQNGYELPYFACWASTTTCSGAAPISPALDFMTFDCYDDGSSAISSMQSIVNDAKAVGMPLYMEETFLESFVPPGYKPTSGVSADSQSLAPYAYAGFAPLDGQWFNAFALFASRNGLTSMTSFDSDIFFTYNNTSPYNLSTYFNTVENALCPPSGTCTGITPPSDVTTSSTYSAYQSTIKQYDVPVIGTQPQSQTVAAGQTATFTVAATGDAPLTYQWYENGGSIPGATSATYNIPETTVSESSSSFYVIVTNSVTSGNIQSNTAVLTVNGISPDGTVLNAGSSGSLLTSAGTWNFGSGTTVWGNAILLNGTQAAGGYATMLLVYNNGQLYADNSASDWFVWNGSGWNVVSGDPRQLSPNGSVLNAGSSGSLVTSAGTWTFGSASNVWGNVILLNGTQAAGGNATMLLVYNNQLYAENSANDWFMWNGSGWNVVSGDPRYSPNGTVLNAGSSGSLVTSAGTWDFGSASDVWGNAILLNGTQAAGGNATMLLVYNNYQLYADNSAGDWFVWNGSGWNVVSGDPRSVH